MKKKAQSMTADTNNGGKALHESGTMPAEGLRTGGMQKVAGRQPLNASSRQLTAEEELALLLEEETLAKEGLADQILLAQADTGTATDAGAAEGAAGELPSVFRLPTGGFHATSFS